MACARRSNTAARKELSVKLGDVLKKERRKKGLAPAQVAKALRISTEEYERLEGGLLPPKLDKAKIRRRLLEIGVDVDYE